jgi:hypothetical protein
MLKRDAKEVAVCPKPAPLVKTARRSAPQVPTSERYVIHSFVLAAGWQAVFYDGVPGATGAKFTVSSK